MQEYHTFNVAADFSRTPGGRFSDDGPYSGQEFRDKYLAPLIEKYDKVEVILDGTQGYPSSFLDEAFGGLARKKKWNVDQFLSHVKLTASGSYQIYVDDILSYIDKYR